MDNKPLIKHVDRTLGALARSIVRNGIAKPLFALNYQVEIVGGEEALSCADGALVVSNHVSFLDGPFLLCEAWPYARIRVTAWHAEYSDWKQWWLMELFSAISLSFASVTRAMSQFSYFFNLIINPMFWFGGAFFPIDDLPEWAQVIAWFVPLTHVVNLYRGFIRGDLAWSMAGDFAWIAVVAAAFYWVALVGMRRRLID